MEFATGLLHGGAQLRGGPIAACQADGARSAAPPPPRARLTDRPAPALPCWLSTLQDTDHTVGDAEPLSHYCDDVTEQGLAERRLFIFDFLVSVRSEFVEYAGGFSLNRCAARPLGDQAH